jgi:hypothetical protein
MVSQLLTIVYNYYTKELRALRLIRSWDCLSPKVD